MARVICVLLTIVLFNIFNDFVYLVASSAISGIYVSTSYELINGSDGNFDKIVGKFSFPCD